MKKLREVFRLKFELGYSNRQIGRSINISPGTVSEYTSLFKAAGLKWEELVSVSDEQLEQLVYRHPSSSAGALSRPHPDWSTVRLELQKKGVTLLLIWNEYKAQYPDGLGYTQFTKCYRRYAKTLEPVMRFTHKAGEKTFVDYAGLTMEWIEPDTGEIQTAQIFVGCLGGSSLIFAEATASQSLADWIGSHIRMFEAFGGVSELLIPDNLRSGVSKAHRYDPDLNQTYYEMALHYNIAIIPTRTVSPRDKAKVESAVLCVERSIIAPLRHQTFTSLHEINQAIELKLAELNNKPMQRIGLSRRQQFEQAEQAALKPLPCRRFEMQEWRQAKVHLDYHICVNKHFYSVPYKFIGEKLDVCLSKHRLDIFHHSQRVALHQRNDRPNQFTTLEEHMPPQHRYYREEEQDASVSRLMFWAKNMGPETQACVEQFFKSRAFPQQAIRAVLGLKRLAERYGQPLFEKACQKTRLLHRYRYKTVEDLLKHGLCEEKNTASTNTITHSALFRGANYFKGEELC